MRFVNEDDARSAAAAFRDKRGGKGRRGGGEAMVVDGVKYWLQAERAVEAATPRTQKGRKEGETLVVSRSGPW